MQNMRKSTAKKCPICTRPTKTAVHHKFILVKKNAPTKGIKNIPQYLG